MKGQAGFSPDESDLSLLPQHSSMVDASAIAPEVASERGYRSITKKTDLSTLGFTRNQSNIPGLLIPIYGVAGELVNYQYRPDNPRIGERGRVVKYETPAGSRVVLDVPRRAREGLGDATIPLLITEGARKADAAVSVGMCCISLAGVWNWRGRNAQGSSTALGDWEQVALKARRVYLVFDSDVLTKAAVHAALLRLKAFLESRGAVVKVALLSADEPAKVGLDDYLAAGGDLPSLLRRAVEIVPALPSDQTRQARPVIIVTGRYNRDVTAELFDALQLANGDHPRFFSQGAVSVRLKGDEGHRVAERMSPDVFSSEADRAADFIKITRDGEVPTAPPMRVVRDALVQTPPFPPLRSIVRTPVFSRDGAVLSTSGYDVQSEIYLDGQPWIDDVRTDIPLPAALALIFDELLADFPFAADADRAHALALLVTPFVRRMIEGPVPLFLLEAPTRGTGKTLFAETIGQIVIGESVAAMPLPRPDEEIDKRITAHLIQAPVVTLLDNVTQLTSPVLAALLTSTRWRGRILGFSEMVDVANETVWLATGNNVTLSEELARRVVRIRLDAQVESPELRNGFKHDLPSWASQQRAELVSAILSLTQHWLHSGSPAFERVSLGKFEEWARTVGGIVECAGIHGFLSDRTHIASKDQQDWRRLVVLWFESHGTRPVAAGQVLQLLRMEDLLMDLWAGRSDLAALQRVGKALARNIDRAFGDYFVRSGGTDSRTRNNTYRLEHRTPQTPETPRPPAPGVGEAPGVTPGVFDGEVSNTAGNTGAAEQLVDTSNGRAGVSGVPLVDDANSEHVFTVRYRP